MQLCIIVSLSLLPDTIDSLLLRLCRGRCSSFERGAIRGEWLRVMPAKINSTLLTENMNMSWISPCIACVYVFSSLKCLLPVSPEQDAFSG